MAAILAYSLIFDPLSRWSYSVAYFGFVMLVAACVPRIFAWTRNNTIDRWIGELSYPIYIGHIFVLTNLWNMGIKGAGWTMLVTVLIAIALTRYIETPIAKFRWRLENR